MADIPKYIHFDLKGASPRISYLKKVIPLISKWGATGLLIEYEDMFPYQKDLAIIRRDTAYSVQQIKEILSIAEQNNLTVIPLVQTFGHLEFVLKHDKLRHFREVELYPNALCPEYPNATELVLSIINQVMELHPKAEQIHIGADEVWHLGKCERCVRKMQIHNWSKMELFLSWVSKIAKLVKKRYPSTNILIWDDMMRNCSPKTLQDFEMGSLVEPMIWKYEADNFDLPIGMFDNYAKVFDSIWVASCYKGATGSTQFLVPIQHHINNHLTWLLTLKEHKSKFKEVKGIALTGWQRRYNSVPYFIRTFIFERWRLIFLYKTLKNLPKSDPSLKYDHYAVLCEMLPVALPSLALCLKVLTNGSFFEGDHDKISQELGFCSKINVHPFPRPQLLEQGMSYPGHELFIAIQIWSNLVCRFQILCNSEGMLGWFSDYFRSKNFTNPAQVENILYPMVELRDNLQELQHNLEKCLMDIFYKDTVEEWIGCFFTPLVKKIDKLIMDGKEQIRLAAVHQDIELQSPIIVPKSNSDVQDTIS